MSQNQMKWLATLLMLVDHIGFLLEAEPMRIIGRLSFPLFAWIFAQNWKRRENASAKPLITRLVLFGIIAQIPYILLFRDLNLNILISLAVAGVTFSQMHKSSKKNLMLTVGLITAQLLGVSYGWYAVACPLLMINLKGGRGSDVVDRVDCNQRYLHNHLQECHSNIRNFHTSNLGIPQPG